MTKDRIKEKNLKKEAQDEIEKHWRDKFSKIKIFTILFNAVIKVFSLVY